MNGKRFLVLAASAIALAIAPLALPPSALAESTQSRTPVSFTLKGCSMLPTGLIVYGSGESFLVVNSRVDQSGVTYIEQNNLVTGKAIDSNGATYLFNYFDHASFQIPPSGFPFTLDLTDHFNLVGNGQANQYQVHFVARVTFYSPTSVTIQGINIHGDPMTCDAI
jgi:hypothetical protein